MAEPENLPPEQTPPAGAAAAAASAAAEPAQEAAKEAAAEAVKPGFFAKAYNKVKDKVANIGEAKGMNKGIRIASAGVGVILGGKAIADAGRAVGVVELKKDDAGNEIQTRGGALFKSAVEAGMTAVALWAAVREHNGEAVKDAVVGAVR